MRWCIGHRGSPEFEPENTRTSFERAIRHDGANALEVDLCMTKDGAIVLWHDWSPHGIEALCRESGFEPSVAFRPLLPQSGKLRRPINELYLEDVVRHFGYATKDGPRERIASAPVQTLEDLVAFAAAHPRLEALFLDVKIPKQAVHLVPVFIDRVEKVLATKKLGCEIVYETAQPTIVDAMKRCCIREDRSFTLDAGPLLGLHRVKTYSAVSRAIHHQNRLATLERPREWCIRPWVTYKRIAEYDLRLMRRHNAGRPRHERVRGVIGYTVDERTEMQYLIELGMIGLQTNRPDILWEVMQDTEEIPRASRPSLAA